METLVFHLRRLWAGANRFRRLVVFGFEQIVLSRLLARHRKIADTVAHALLHTKGIERHPPELEVKNSAGEREPNWSRGFTSVNAALFLNLRNADELTPCRHARPAPAFRAVYLWDSAFIAQVWKWWDPDVAFDVLNAVIQGRDGGRFQHFVSEFTGSKFTQPPLIAWSLARLQETADPRRFRAWVEASYPALAEYHNWLRAHRGLENGLYAWAHAYESGVENAPRFGTRDERRLRDTRSIGAPDLCAYMILDCEALAQLARILGKEADLARYQREAEALRVTVNDLLWDDAEGLYFDRTEDGGFIRSRTVASLLPLWAGAPDPACARRLIAHILSPGGFNSLIPIPSVALDDPDFERDMWRGPVWVNTAFAVIEGLRRYGADAAAAELAFRLCDGVYRTYGETGHFYEFYDPTAYGVGGLFRKRGNRWKRITLGGGPVADFVGWTGLVNTMVLETLCGLSATPSGPQLQPRFPQQAAGQHFCLCLPLWEAEIEFDVLPGGAARGEIRAHGGKRSFTSNFGEPIPWLRQPTSSEAVA